MNDNLRIIMADDHEIVRMGVRAIIEKEPSWTVVGEAENGRELIECMRKADCDLVILDIGMPEFDGIKAIDHLHLSFPEVKILVLTMLRNEPIVRQILARKIDGFLTKDDVVIKLQHAIEEIQKGNRFISPKVMDSFVDTLAKSEFDPELPLNVLTERERQVVQLIAKGMKSKEIASELKISLNTVSNHRANILHKLGATSVSDVVKFAVSHGLT